LIADDDGAFSLDFPLPLDLAVVCGVFAAPGASALSVGNQYQTLDMEQIFMESNSPLAFNLNFVGVTTLSDASEASSIPFEALLAAAFAAPLAFFGGISSDCRESSGDVFEALKLQARCSMSRLCQD